ncbi:hypothetical protein F4808DRAFT_465203 [Astrocystis sublimbata]|nr:hypothetical protein F4808DRAFT_465203 [Astrocystis sublimbata]
MEEQHHDEHRPLPDADYESPETTPDGSIRLQYLDSVSSATSSRLSNYEAPDIDPEDEQAEERHAVPPAVPTTTPPSQTTPNWLPYTLRRIPLFLILGFCMLLDVAVIVVHVISSSNAGVVNDYGSTAKIIASKFVPTLLAVAFSLLASILLDDVKRTEPFARMASCTGADSKQSLRWTAGFWLPFPSPMGKGRLPLFSSTLVFVLGTLVVSPLSSVLFASETVVLDQKTMLHQLDLGSLTPIQPTPLATTYFRTISSILQNVSTSAWITNDYVILPFWPGNLSLIPLSPILSDKVQAWSTSTAIFSVDLYYKPMDYKWNSPGPSGDNYSITLASQSGCSLDFDLGNSSMIEVEGGETWVTTNDVTAYPFVDLEIDVDGDHTHLGSPNVTVHDCNEDEVLLSFTRTSFKPSNFNPANFSLSGQACQRTYYVGNSTVVVNLGKGQSVVTVNETEYKLTRTPISAPIANTAFLDNIFFDDANWTTHLDGARYAGHSHFVGPANLLGAKYQFDSERIIADAATGQSMQRVRRQFFAEILHTAFELMTVANAVDVPGSVISASRRVVVVPAVAISMEIVLSLLSILLATILYTTRPSNRVLGLYEDPSPIVSVTRLLTNSPSTLKTFTESSDGTPSNALNQSLSKSHFILTDGQIEATVLDASKTHDSREPLSSKTQADRSVDASNNHQIFSMWLLVPLLVLLCLTLAGIATLYHLSRSQGLYNTIFVYNISISIGSKQFNAVNPASILTALVAVIIGTWWGSFDTTLRKVQPYLALAKDPIPGYNGIAMSYKSSYLTWAAYRAARRRHWVLVLVSTGAFLTQVLTIAMSSLWTRAPGTLTESVGTTRTLELRSVPILTLSHHDGSEDDGKEAIEPILSNLTSSWIYGATTQLTLQGPDPSWSSDGWSFVPSNINLEPSRHVQNTGNSSELSFLSVNVTVKTPATRARLECSPYNFLDNKTRWLTKWDLTNETYWDISSNPSDLKVGYGLGPDQRFEDGVELGDSTSFYPGGGNAGRGISLIFPNFTVKWIRGRAVEGIQQAIDWSDDSGGRLLFDGPPKMAALNCQPVIEMADAEVTVDADTGRVTSYEILETPRAYEDAWNSPWVKYRQKHNTDPSNSRGSDSRSRDDGVNTTVSHGIIFVTSLLGAADLDNLGTHLRDHDSTEFVENTEEQTFNIRQSGLNVDYMTYAMLSLAGLDRHDRLLDPATLARTANRTFATMYQHFINHNLSLESGGYVYQPVGARLPADVGQREGGPEKESRETAPSPSGRTEIVMKVSRPVELLMISTPAAWICIAILSYLIVSCGVLMLAARGYNNMLPGTVDTIADTAALVAGSGKLLELARGRSTNDIKSDRGVLAKLDWFDDAEGQKRWGVELFEGEAEPDGHDSDASRQDESP